MMLTQIHHIIIISSLANKFQTLPIVLPRKG
jgi:hypothetical protein